MKRKYLSLAIGCVLVAPALPAMSQEAATEAGAKATQLQTVTVTARKREETLQDVPVAVTAFTSEALDKLNIQDIADLGPQVPNMTVYAARGSNTTLTAYIRGVGQADPLWGVDPGVGIYLDDVYIARPQGALLDVFDVERIEVLRGPQGTLYGKNTIGGAVKYISRGLPQETSGFASVTIGNYNQVDVKAGIGGEIGGKDSGLRGRVAVANLTRDGFGENLGTYGGDVSDKDITAVRAQLGAFSHEDFDVQFALDWMKDDSGMRGGKLLAPNTNALVNILFPGTSAIAPLDDRYDIRSGMRNENSTEMKGGSVTVNWRPSDNWVLKYVAALRESDTVTAIDFDMLPAKIADVRAQAAAPYVWAGNHSIQSFAAWAGHPELAAALFALPVALLAFAFQARLLVGGGDGVEARADDRARRLDRAADDGGARADHSPDDAALQQQRAADDGQKGGRPREGLGHVNLPRRLFCVTEVNRG